MSDKPSKLANLKELVGLLSLSAQVQREISDILSDFEADIYRLTEDNKRLIATVRKQDERIKSLEHRYSDLLYRIAELKHN